MATTPEDKRAQLAALLRQQLLAPRQAPLSFSQERMWFLDQWSPGSAASIPVAIRLSGQLDVELLQRGLREIVRRHETLRTTFLTAPGGRPIQSIAPSLELPLPLVDLRGLAESEREREAWQRISAEARQPFELTRGPLLRLALYQLAAREHLLLINLHHIITDAWSLGVFTQELAVHYQASIEGRPAPLPPLPLQYADYVTWQRKWLQGEVLETQLGYWRSRLDPEAVLDLPTDHPRPPVLGTRGAREELVLPLALSQAIEDFSRREDRTLFITLLSAFAILLSRYSGQTDLTVGTAVAGRPREELEGLIGLFINTLALRASLAGQPTFRELMERLHETALGAFAHQELPFEKLVEELKPARHLDRAPLVQVMLILQNTPRPPLEAPGLVMEALPLDTGAAKYELALFALRLPQGLRLTAEYSTELFEARSMSRLLGHLQTLLAAAVEGPRRRISELPLLGEEERRRLLSDCSGPRVEYPREACVHAPFEDQARRTPGAPALTFEGDTLTYRELEERANRLAHLLRAEGVGPEMRVGLCLERSHELVIAMLAILKAGGAYVPLDPLYPAERLGFMLQDSGARVLLTRKGLSSKVAAEIRTVLLDEVGERLASLSSQPPAANTVAGNLAYVLYTSGSTGKPKGVMVPHRTVSNFFTAMDARIERPEQGAWLAVTSASFDISVLELLWTLARGFNVVVQAELNSSGWLVRQLERHRVTHLQCTPSLAQALLLDPQAAQALHGLRQMLVGGEALPAELARQLVERLPPGGLLNMYGPTETTVWSSSHTVREVKGAIPLGTALANTTLYVLDAEGWLLPVGVPGELFIGGEGVVRGYLGRPELTAERFVPDGFGATPGARLYRTGDRARWRPDGTVEFLGRMDFQVKLRGHRIELGEIESTLEQHPSVRQAVVVAREFGAGDTRLVAYVTGRAGEQPVDTGTLRGALQAKLPESMVPSAWVVLEALPLTPNGKVDRKALPAPELGKPRAGRIFVAPRTELERTIAQVWKVLLGAEQIGLEDNFFELGGHSLLATQLRNQLHAKLAVDLPLQALFNAPTVAGVAALVEQERRLKSSEAEEPIARRIEEAFPLERQQILEEYLRRKIARGLRREAGSLPEDGSLDGLELRLVAAELRHDLKQDFKFELFPHEVHEHPSIPALAEHLLAEMRRLADLELFVTDVPLAAYPRKPYRQQAASTHRAAPERKNPGMVFMLSSPRAGSTLSRVMLAGHPKLFSPPEMKLLFFESMREWRHNVGLGTAIEWTEGGLLWALMELQGLDSAAGQKLIDALVAEDTPIQDVYARLQERAGQRLLVDKTPGYSLDPDTLLRAETLFDQPKYIYLVRHPYSVMESLLRVRLDRLAGPLLFEDEDVDPHVVAETIWALSNRNLLDFFDRIGQERVHWLRYEELVSEPTRVMTGLCDFLGIPFDERVVQPYDGKRERMLAGVGDTNIMRHDRIEAELGESWKRIRWPRPLDPGTHAIAKRLGYEVE